MSSWSDWRWYLNGYRWFLIILPIVGFFFGFMIGAQAMTAIFGTAFLATVTSWVVGFIVAIVFAVLSYFFYFIGVAIFIGSFGYALGYAIMGLFNADLTILTFLVALALGVIFAVLAFVLNIQKYLVIIATSFIGAGAIILGILAAFGFPPEALGRNALAMVLQDLSMVGDCFPGFGDHWYGFADPPQPQLGTESCRT